jgi:hypothetical protein
MRMMRNSLASDSGFLGVFLGGLVYLAVVVGVSMQARAGGVLARELAGTAREITTTLLGMQIFVVVCVQGGALHFFRVSLQGDFRTVRWCVLPVGRRALRSAYVIDSLLNPGAIAALVATWLLMFAYARPSSAFSYITCLLVSPVFVALTQSILIVASDLLGRFRLAVSWLFLLPVVAASAFVAGYGATLASGATPAFVRGVLLNHSTEFVLRLPPWGLPLFVVERLESGRDGALFAALAAAVAGTTILLAAGNRIAASTEPE